MSDRLLTHRLLIPLCAALCVFALTAAACGKSNDQIAAQQIQQGNDACPQGCTSSLPGCTIKGNISAKGTKVYHTRDQQSYKGIVIQPQKGERWFCNEPQALANGWKKSIN
jgi:hypothetical protein